MMYGLVYTNWLISLTATSHLTIFMRGMRTNGKFKRIITKTCNAGRLAGKTSSVPLIEPTHARRIAK